MKMYAVKLCDTELLVFKTGMTKLGLALTNEQCRAIVARNELLYQAIVHLSSVVDQLSEEKSLLPSIRAKLFAIVQSTEEFLRDPEYAYKAAEKIVEQEEAAASIETPEPNTELPSNVVPFARKRAPTQGVDQPPEQ